MKTRTWLYTIPLRFRSLFKKRQVEQELNEEMEFHLAMQQEALVAGGMSEHEARLAAMRQFDGLAQRMEECRDMRKLGWLEDFRQDLRHSARSLWRTPGFALIAILSLALGIGATSALFSVVDATLLKPLALPDPGRLVYLAETKDGRRSGGNPARLMDWAQASGFASAGGYYTEDMVLTGEGSPERLEAMRTFSSMIPTLGLTTMAGRLPTAEEERGRGGSVAVLGHKFWQRHFQSNLSVIGRTLTLGGAKYQVIGVMRPGAGIEGEPDIWAPAPAEVQNVPRIASFHEQIARLRDNASVATVQSELDAIAERLAHQFPDTDRRVGVRVESLQEHLTSEARTPLLMLFGIVAAVLLIACVNVAGLLIARGLARQREAAIRISLGAGQVRLMRLFLTESLLLALAGGTLGLLIASAGLDVLKLVLPRNLPRLEEASLDFRVVCFVLAASLASALIAGLIPALQASRTAVATPLRQGGRGTSGGSYQRLRGMLVIGEIAVSAVLLVAAGLLSISLMRIGKTPLGFAPEQTIAFSVNFSWDTPGPRLNSFSNALLERLQAMPGVRASGVVDRLPLRGGSQSVAIAVRGQDLPPQLAGTQISLRTASPGYFGAAGIPLKTGELFQPHAGENGPHLAVVNERFARTFFGSASPIGREIASKPRNGPPGPKATWYRIVGIVGDVRQQATDSEAPMEVFLPWGDQYWPMMSYVVRGNGDVRAMASSIRETVQSVDPNVIVERLQPMSDHIAEATRSNRTMAWLVGCFAGAALLLAAIGLYGLLSSEVARRTQEFGIRLALGAQPRELLTHSLRRGLTWSAIGLAFGLLAAAFGSKLLASLLYGVTPHELMPYVAAGSALLAVAACACLLPARRAARVDPIITLRHE